MSDDGDRERDAGLTRRSMLAGIGGAAATGAWSAHGALAGTIAARAAAPEQAAPRLLVAPPAAGAWIELSRSALAANVAAVRAAAGGRPIMGVVKANAYGHGLVPVARELERAGVEALMVITVDEALALRAAGINVPVLNYGPFDRDAAEDLVDAAIDQAVFTADAVQRMATAAARVGRPARLQVVFDTGLGRVGAPPRQAADLFDAIARVQSGGDITITAVATALSEDPDYDRVQLERYEGLCEEARAARIDIGTRHVAASAAVLDFPAAHLDMVRPGIMLYGQYPNDRSMRERPIELTPVLSLKARVAYLKRLQPGDSIGYHRAWVAPRETTVATLPIGHSEGYPPGAPTAGAAVAINGRTCALVGEITSNHLEVAVPDDAVVRIGDEATLIGGGAPQLSAPGLVPQAAAAPGAAPWLPTAPQVGEWGGFGVYGTLMRLNPLLPRMLT